MKIHNFYRPNFDRFNLSQHYRFLSGCKYLASLEKLVIKDNRLSVDWRPILDMRPTNYPNLKKLSLPQPAVTDFDVSAYEIREERESLQPGERSSLVPYFPGLGKIIITGLF